MAYEIAFPASLEHLTEDISELWYRISDCAIELLKDRDRVVFTAYEGEGCVSWNAARAEMYEHEDWDYPRWQIGQFY